MKIEVISDVICPWCFLGKRRLDKALSLVPDVKADVTFRPFFLDPSIPPEGLSREGYIKSKFGDRDLKALHQPLVGAGARDGVPYHFDKITRTPNTLNAHRLIRWALQAGKQPQVVEALFCAYWRDGKDVGAIDVLAEIASTCGMDGKEVLRLLSMPTDAKEVMEEVQKAYELGVQGVPTFIIDQRYGISGAQEAEALADAIRQVAVKA
jgi:predicted DsbA family dithiol-disulfide isomerase